MESCQNQQDIGREDGSWATLTGKLEMENYLHPDAIKDAIDIDITFDDMENVPLFLLSYQST